jgi:phenylpyruvate tautomerase PptA (4-oxalocrotonate tautomerase family)
MPFACIDLIQEKSSECRAAAADIVYRGIVDILEAPDGDRFIVVSEHTADNLIYDPPFPGFSRSPDFILVQVTSTVGTRNNTKFDFCHFVADELKLNLGVRRDDIMINMVFVDKEDWSFGDDQPW